MTPKEEQNYKWDIETSWSQGFDKGKKETIAKIRESIKNLNLKEYRGYDYSWGFGDCKKEVLKLLEDIK